MPSPPPTACWSRSRPSTTRSRVSPSSCTPSTSCGRGSIRASRSRACCSRWWTHGRGSRPTSSLRSAVTSASSSSTRSSRGRSGWRRRPATACPRSSTTRARPARMRTGRWRWSLSGVPEMTGRHAGMSANAARRGLGRGLDVLIGGTPAVTLIEVAVGEVRPSGRQPRRRFDAEATAGLADSVRAAGVATVPALVREADDRDSLVLALVENVAREQLSPVEEARAYAVLLDEFELSLGEVAVKVGRSKPSVSNRLRLLELSADVLELVERGELSEGHARAVLAVPDHEDRRRLARRIVRSGLSVRAAERAARESGAATRRPRAPRDGVDPVLAERARTAAERLTGRPARVLAGRIELPFADEYDLAELVEALERISST